jgi:hypothetical protein
MFALDQDGDASRGWRSVCGVAKADVRRWWKARESELRGLMWEWDPLEFVGAPEGEYDCVVDDLLSRLVARGSREDLVGVLEGEAEHFGVALGSSAELADRVLAWWAQVPPQPAVE